MIIKNPDKHLTRQGNKNKNIMTNNCLLFRQYLIKMKNNSAVGSQVTITIIISD